MSHTYTVKQFQKYHSCNSVIERLEQLAQRFCVFTRICSVNIQMLVPLFVTVFVTDGQVKRRRSDSIQYAPYMH